MRQLVGLSCAGCRQRIGSILEGECCTTCGEPVHLTCKRPSASLEGVCQSCGSNVPHPTPIEVRRGSENATRTPDPVKANPLSLGLPRNVATKSPLLALTLSFFLPGAGLWYLGRWGWGFVNLVVVLAIGLIAVFVLAEGVFDQSIRYIAIGCSGGSGGLAMALAQQINQKEKSDANA